MASYSNQENHELTRRAFINKAGYATLGLGSLGVLLAACGSDAISTTVATTSTAAARQLQLRTMGIGTTVLDSVLTEFQTKTGIPATGTQTGFGDMVPQWIQGGYRDQWDVMEAQGAQIAPLVAAGTLQPIKVADITHWNDLLEVFRVPGAAGQDGDGHPFTQIYTKAARDSGRLDEVWVVPTVWNGDTIGYRTDLIDEKLTSYGALWDPKYQGKVALFNSSLRAPMEVLATFVTAGEYQTEGTIGNPSKADVDFAIDFLIERKAEGQFRLLWDDFGAAIELLDTGEVSLMNAWEPIVREVAARGKPAVYATVKEGYNMWFHGIVLSAESQNYDAAVEYANFWHEGFAPAVVANQGYITPTPSVAQSALKGADSPIEGVNAWDYWYDGKGRDRGSVNDIASSAAWWWQFPDESEYLNSRWQDFVAS